MTNTVDPTDTNYDPSKDTSFMDKLNDSIGTAKEVIDQEGYAGTGMTAAQLVEMYGTNPDGSPRTEPAPDTPSCPAVSLSDGPFDTTTIPPGCSAPLSQECADFYNAQIDAQNKA